MARPHTRGTWTRFAGWPQRKKGAGLSRAFADLWPGPLLPTDLVKDLLCGGYVLGHLAQINGVGAKQAKAGHRWA